MQKTTFKILKMDCPSEEQLIRMALSGLENIQLLHFDLPNRQLTVFHSENFQPVFDKLNTLNLNTILVENIIVNESSLPPGKENTEKKILARVLIINFIFFIFELIAGYISHSMGLVADSFDMLSDSMVYGLALFAASGGTMRKIRVAQIAGIFQVSLAIIGFFEVLRRFMFESPVPDFQTMLIVSVFALLANAACLYLLQKSKSNEAHIRASIIFTSTDVIANIGVILAGSLVYLTNSKYPDLIVGILVFILVLQGAVKILKLAKK